MKLILSILTVLLTASSALALQCGSWVRAANSDQKKMVLAVVFNPSALGLKLQEVYGMKITDYVSWKGEQLACAADIYHRANIEIKSLGENFEICTNTLVLHRKDDFVTGDATANYKIESNIKTCVAADEAQKRQVSQCLRTMCPPVGDNPTFPDYQNGCQCKFFDDMISFVNEQPKYENFYEPDVLFPKPDGVTTLFP